MYTRMTNFKVIFEVLKKSALAYNYKNKIGDWNQNEK